MHNCNAVQLTKNIRKTYRTTRKHKENENITKTNDNEGYFTNKNENGTSDSEI